MVDIRRWNTLAIMTYMERNGKRALYTKKIELIKEREILRDFCLQYSAWVLFY